MAGSLIGRTPPSPRTSMLRSTLVAATVAISLTPIAYAGAQSMTYAPGTHRYAITAELHQTGGMPGMERETLAKSSQFVTVVLAARADTIDFTITIDSVAFEATPAMATPLDSMRGKVAKGAMSPRGKIHRIVGADSLSSAIAKTLGGFFPELPANSATGTSWTDTTITPLEPNTPDLGKLTTIVTSKIAADTTIGGLRAWTIEKSSEGSGGGVRSAGGSEMVMQAVLKSRGTIYFGKAGVYLGAAATSSSNITMSVASAGITIPLKQEITTRVRLLDTPAAPR
jgi:hypothetical protein